MVKTPKKILYALKESIEFLRKEFSILFRHVQGWTRFRGLELLFLFWFGFLRLPIGIFTDGSCFDVFGYTELNI